MAGPNLILRPHRDDWTAYAFDHVDSDGGRWVVCDHDHDEPEDARTCAWRWLETHGCAAFVTHSGAAHPGAWQALRYRERDAWRLTALAARYGRVIDS